VLPRRVAGGIFWLCRHSHLRYGAHMLFTVLITCISKDKATGDFLPDSEEQAPELRQRRSLAYLPHQRGIQQPQIGALRD
jgi:hypothetical protein